LGDGVSDSPTGNAVGLRYARNGDRPIGQSRDRARANMSAAVIHEIFVNLVSENNQIMAARYLTNRFDFAAVEYLARGIGRSADHDPLGTRSDCALQVAQLKAPVRGMHPDVTGCRPDRFDRIEVITIVGL